MANAVDDKTVSWYCAHCQHHHIMYGRTCDVVVNGSNCGCTKNHLSETKESSLDKSQTILDKAAKATSSDRNKIYGHPRDHFRATTLAVSIYLHRRGLLPKDKWLDASDWPMILVIDKVIRNAGNLTATLESHIDSLVDIAGYARTAEMLGEAE